MAIFTLVACENNDESKSSGNNSNSVSLTLTSEQFLNYDLFGGEGVITYTLENANGTDSIEVKSDSSWVTTTLRENSIEFEVDFNDTTTERSAIITVSYGTRNFSVVVTQAAGYTPTVDFEAEYCNGTYYGVLDGSDFNYFIILSDKGVASSSATTPDSTMYRLDLYSDVFGGFSVATLPDGTFIYDGSSTGYAGTFGDKYSSYLKTTGSYDIIEERIIGGVVKVKNGKIDAILRLQNNEVHRIKYSGDLKLTYPGMPEPPFSMLNGDYSFEHEGSVGYAAYYFGDRYQLGYDNWMIQMIEDTGSQSSYEGDYFMISILAPKSDMDINAIIGEYRLWEEDLESYERTFIPGYVTENTPAHSFFMTCVGGVITYNPSAPVSGGTIKIEEIRSNIKITFDCVDDKGNKICGSYLASSAGFQVFPM